jgi:hypothetical protein
MYHSCERREVQNFNQKYEGKRPLRKPRHRWENNINMNRKETGLEDLDGPVMGYCEHSSELAGSMEGGEFLEYLRPYWLRNDFALWN